MLSSIKVIIFTFQSLAVSHMIIIPLFFYFLDEEVYKFPK